MAGADAAGGYEPRAVLPGSRWLASALSIRARFCGTNGACGVRRTGVRMAGEQGPIRHESAPHEQGHEQDDKDEAI